MITDSGGSTWNYTYQGSFSSTTTTTEQTNVPYTDTTVGLYATAYNERGTPVASARRAESFRQGGDGANTLGYNLGARLAAIHIKEHLLNDVVGRVDSVPIEPAAVVSEAEKAPTAVPASDASTYQPNEAGGERLWTNAASGVGNIFTFANGRKITLPAVDDSASSAVTKCLVDAKSPACFDNWTDSQKSFSWLLELGSAIRAARSTKDDLLGTVADGLKPT